MVVRLARDAHEIDEALELRRRVFCGEQGVAPAADQDGRDPHALHVIAFAEGALRGTCRVLVEGEVAKLGRMAVEGGSRRRGIGRAVLEAAETSARAAGATRAALHAQVPVLDFYIEGGYSRQGRPFVEEGIPHVAMEKRLA